MDKPKRYEGYCQDCLEWLTADQLVWPKEAVSGANCAICGQNDVWFAICEDAFYRADDMDAWLRDEVLKNARSARSCIRNHEHAKAFMYIDRLIAQIEEAHDE